MENQWPPLRERILRGVGQALGLVIGNISNVQEFEHLKMQLALGDATAQIFIRIALELVEGNA